MTRKRWLVLLVFLAALGTLAWLALMPRKPVEVPQPAQAGAGVHGTVLVRSVARDGEKRRDAEVVLPDFVVSLKDAATNQVSEQVKTDLFGRYRFPPQKQGTYKLVWAKQNGWDEGESTEQIVVTANTQYPLAVEIKPEKGLAVLTGRVQLADGGSPWYSHEFFAVERFATVEAADDGGRAIGTPVRANFAGDYAVAAPLKAQFKVTAYSLTAKASRVLQPDDFRADGSPKAFDLTLDNHRPRLDAMVTEQDRRPVRHVAPGSTVKLSAIATDADNDPLKYTWNVDGGTVEGTGRTVDWKLPQAPGAYGATVLISDGRGGDLQAQTAVLVGGTGDTFSGRAVDTSGQPIAKADVTVNGQKTVTDPTGYFTMVVPPATRYVLNIHRAGFAPLSRLFDWPSNGRRWTLVPAQVTEVDPTKPISLVDRRPVLEKNRLLGAVVQVPAGALVDVGGNKPAGNLTASIATLDPGRDEAPGDGLAKDGAKDAGLLSHGSVFVEFTDAGGKTYNLAAGQKATVNVPVSAPMLAAAAARIPIWTYDETDGYWKALGAEAVLDKPPGTYTGQVTHFSTIDMGRPVPVSSVRVHSDISVPTGLTLRVSGVGFATVKQTVLDGPLNAIYRIPANGQVKLEVLDGNGNVLPNAVIEGGNTSGATGTPLPNNIVTAGPADPNPWPPFPYSECKPVTIKLNAPWSGYPASPFLTFKRAGTDPTNTYYKVIDPLNKRTTLGDWWQTNGFDPAGGAAPSQYYARTSYLNNNDLGSGRDMHFTKHTDGTLAAYVTNYSRGGPFDQNPVYADDAAARSYPGATVCMEYSPVENDPAKTKIVKFFVFAGNGNGAGAPRQPAADLDGFGKKFVPNLCLNCHGGDYYVTTPTLADVNTGASFRELDLSTYKFPQGRLTPNATEQADLKKQNQFIVATGAARKPILDLISGWYAPMGTGATQDNSYTPTNWQGAPQAALYQDAIKVSCRTCHIAFVCDDTARGLDWNRYDQLVTQRNGDLPSLAIGATLSGSSSRRMPHALATYRNFWLDQSPLHRPKRLWEYSDPPQWLPIGAPGP